MSKWSRIKPLLREQAEYVINNDPSVLLEREGGPVGEQADVVLARLYGADDQVDYDWRISRAVPVLYAAIPERLTAIEPAEPTSYSSLRTAEYRLQSNFAKLRLDGRFAPEDVSVRSPDFTFSVLFLRYRRRLGGLNPMTRGKL